MAKPKSRKSSKSAKPAAKSKPAAAAPTRKGTKQEAVIALLRRPAGTSLDAICKATDWLPHTARAFLSATLGKRLALKVVRKREGETSIYRIA